ncbi:collagen alpha-1(I) chain-like isoform X6 [Achroia grisella]|uniref:collagen alpha-1(I) chain-like isoform X6 n=1 Tax=Achroia grisella TaxID=688607 RepID=UPI0027D2297F|nr:collagen alpha-1(I) chain-like isoform X6 [Achroia grisella]
MIKEKEKGGGARLKDEPNDPTEPGHGSRPPSASLPTPAALKKEPDEHRVKMEPHSQSGGDDSAAELAVDGIKTEIDGLMDSDVPHSGDPTKSPSCDLGGPGSLKSERLSSDSNDILDPQTGLRGSAPNVQQSQIFVFSTLLANKGAEAVISGQHHSIIAYHCAQPGTKKYLEKHPLKMGQFNKQSPAQWLNNMAMAKRAGMRGGPNMMGGPNQMGHMMGGPMGPNMGPMGHGGMGHMGPNMMGPNRMGGPGNQMMMMKGGPGPMGQMGPGMGPMDGFPGGTPSCGVMDGIGADGEMPWDTKNPSVMSNGMANGGGGGGGALPPCSEPGDAPPQDAPPTDAPCQQGPKGVKIPDENLTPQQRAHREEQLATIRKMQQMLFPESGSGANQGPGDGTQPPNEVNPPNSAGNMNMPFPPMSGMGPNGPMGSGPNGPMVSMPNSMNSGPSCSMAGPLGPNGPMGPGPMGPGGPMGPNGPMGGPMGGMGGPGGMGMGGHGSMGPNGMMGPNGPMMPGMGPNGPMGPLGPCGMKGIRGACGGPDMKGGMCTDMHMGRGCGGPMGRMPNPMGGMGGPKPCMMGGPHMGPRMMPGPNINAMNGGIMMDGMMGGMVHGECGDHHPLPNGPMCDEYGRGRNMGPGDPGGLGPGGMGPGGLGPGGLGPGGAGRAGPGLRSPKSPAAGADFDWQKLHHQFFDDPKSMDTELSTQVKSPCSERGGCLPPPPYGASPLHRSASVPIATASPGHGGVQLPMSAEPSRAPSALSSPAHCKPPPKQDAPEILEKLDDGVFVRTLQCLAAQQQKNQQGGSHGKEPSLMPVPSPQQISYLNQFEGQELTIQKQPNTSLKDNGPPSNSGGQTPQSSSNQKSPAGMMPGTPEPHSSLAEQRTGRFSLEQSPGFNNPQTPTSAAPTKCAQDEKSRPSPSSNRSSQESASKTPQRDSNLNQGPYAPASSASSCAGSVKSSCSVASSTAPTTASGSIEDNMSASSETTLSGGPNSTSLPGPFPSACSMSRPDNIPINPNQGPGGPLGGGAASFDPISSLAQMSQQLTSGAPGAGPAGPAGPPPCGPFAPAPHHLPHHHAMHPHSHPHMMINDLGCHMDNMGGPGMGGPMEGMMGGGDFPPDINLSPKMGAGAMGGMGGMPGDGMMAARMPNAAKMPPFNGANVQVKASAPNTIQYLPTRPQMACNSGPRGPPSLEFLQRVTSPMQMEGKGGVQYFPGARGLDVDGMRGVMRGPGMLRMAPYPAGFGSPPKMPEFGAPGPAPAAMCAGFRGGKGPMGPAVRMGAAQPLPPSMAGPGPGFKGQGFAMQSTADPNYAAQFHNFQQQLYATGSRAQHQGYPPYQPSK